MSKSLNQIVICDIESTCWEPIESKPVNEESEIIEIGICILDLSKRNAALNNKKLAPYGARLPLGELVSKRSIIVRPEYSRVSEFCTKLTTLTQADVDKGVSFKEACDVLRSEFKSQNRTWASYGDYDRKQFEKDCAKKNVKYPFGPRHINIKNLFAHVQGLPKEVGMPTAIKLIHEQVEGTHHRGDDDAWNIAKILRYILAGYGT